LLPGLPPPVIRTSGVVVVSSSAVVVGDVVEDAEADVAAADAEEDKSHALDNTD
jgi:magnesium-transporting ATPase (P-type)